AGDHLPRGGEHQALEGLRIAAPKTGKNVFEPVEMLDTGERRKSRQRQAGNRDVDTARQEIAFDRCCRPQGDDAPRALLARGPITAANRAAPRDHDLQHGQRRCHRSRMRDLGAQRITCRKIDLQGFESASQAIEMQAEKSRHAIAHQDGLEHAVTILQAAIVRGHLVAGDTVDPTTHLLVRLDFTHVDSNARSMPSALARVSSISRCGIESATIPPPARNSIWSPRSVMVRIRMLKSASPSVPSQPSDPVYAPRPSPSSSAMICMQRTLGHPVMVPPGNSA